MLQLHKFKILNSSKTWPHRENLTTVLKSAPQNYAENGLKPQSPWNSVKIVDLCNQRTEEHERWVLCSVSVIPANKLSLQETYFIFSIWYCSYAGRAKHRKDELICRQVQGDEWKNAMKFVEHQLPRAYHLKCLSNLPEDEIESGCRDSAPSKTVLRQIRYEARKVLTPFEDESKSLSEIYSQ